MTAKKKHTPSVTSQAPAGPGTVLEAHNHGPTNYIEIQQNEVAVLQSIYMEDFEEVKVKPAAWSVSYRLIKFHVLVRLLDP